jgi:hypothetical protein
MLRFMFFATCDDPLASWMPLAGTGPLPNIHLLRNASMAVLTLGEFMIRRGPNRKCLEFRLWAMTRVPAVRKKLERAPCSLTYW